MEAEQKLLNWLMSEGSFKREYSALLLASVSAQFPALKHAEADFDIIYLLRCASILSQSKNSSMQDIALRIAQFTLQKKDSNESTKAAAQFILNTLKNRRAITLAYEKGLLISSDNSWKDSFIGNVNWVKSDISSSIWLRSGLKIDTNGFQKSLWDALEKYQYISISAPTSAGKSYIIKQWINDQLHKGLNTIVAYIVPTRALIGEVESDFKRELTAEIKESRVNVTSFPFPEFASEGRPCIYVLTQERLQLLQNENKAKLDILIVDEAYKLADNDRGILLQHVIEGAVVAAPNAKVIYLSPMASNPELLVEDNENKFSQQYDDATINQNLIWLTQKRGKHWNLQLCHRFGKNNLGDIALANNPSPASLKLPMLAHALGQAGGNVIYVNRAADAEKMAAQLIDLIGFDNQLIDQRINDLVDLCERVIHRQFKLIEALKYGVGFHYGSMPSLIREEVESLFKQGLLNFLICTSTLVEGVNLPCKNIFIRSPTRGSGNDMTSADFWNLAGRAGRWGKDFQGNIICVDPEQWNAPTERILIPLSRATNDALSRLPELLDFIKNGTPREAAAEKETRIFESMASYLSINRQIYGSLKHVPWMRHLDQSVVSEIENAVCDFLNCDKELFNIAARHPGISPLAIKNLFSYFKDSPKDAERFLVPFASDTDATKKFAELFKSLHGRLTNEFTDSDPYLIRQAIVTVNWMQGRPIKRIIEERKKAIPDEEIHLTIRTIFQDIETVARYRAPKYISCYNDTLRLFYKNIARDDLISEIDDISLFLEMGVNTKTQISLLHLGLSRTSAVEIKQYITDDNYTLKECIAWFVNPNNKWRSRNIPEIVKREIDKMLVIHG